MSTYLRADGQETRVLFRRELGRRTLSAEWLPAGRYTRLELFYGHDLKRGDRAVTLAVGRFNLGLYS